MVEAPGTAPGSATLILSRVYRHSRRSGEGNIGDPGRRFEGETAWRRRPGNTGRRKPPVGRGPHPPAGPHSEGHAVRGAPGARPWLRPGGGPHGRQRHRRADGRRLLRPRHTGGARLHTDELPVPFQPRASPPTKPWPRAASLARTRNTSQSVITVQFGSAPLVRSRIGHLDTAGDPANGNARASRRGGLPQVRVRARALSEPPGRKGVGWKEPLLNDATERYLTRPPPRVRAAVAARGGAPGR